MTTITRDPALVPVFTGHRQLAEAVRRLIERYKVDAGKLERMNLWADARAIWHDIQQLEALLNGHLLDRIADELKEVSKMIS